MEVTVVIPCFNAAPWLAKAIDSALNQQDISTHVIVVDDASTDASPTILNQYADRVEIITHAASLGGNISRQEGLDKATTPWVQFLDADDELEPDKIAQQLAIASDSTDLLYGPLQEVHYKGSTEITRYLHEPQPPYDPTVHWLRWQLAQTGTALWRTSAIQRIGGWKAGQVCCQDNELCLRALQHDLTITYCSHPGLLYRVWTEETVSRKDPSRIIHERTRLTDQYLTHLKGSHSLGPQHIAAAGQSFFEMARSLAAHNLRTGLRYARERQEAGCWKVAGPAASPSYSALCRLGGFALAERLAHGIRTRKKRRS